MKVYIVYEPDADTYCGIHIHGVFSSESNAKKYIETDGKWTSWDFDEYEVDELIVGVEQ